MNLKDNNFVYSGELPSKSTLLYYFCLSGRVALVELDEKNVFCCFVSDLNSDNMFCFIYTLYKGWNTPKVSQFILFFAVKKNTII